MLKIPAHFFSVWLLILLVFSDSAQAVDTFVYSEVKNTNILIENNHLGLLLDAEDKLTIQDVIHQDFGNYHAGFLMLQERNLSHWCKSIIQIPSNNTQPLLIEFPDHRIDFLELYFVVNDKIIEHYQVGDHVRFATRPILHKNFVFCVASL